MSKNYPADHSGVPSRLSTRRREPIAPTNPRSRRLDRSPGSAAQNSRDHLWVQEIDLQTTGCGMRADPRPGRAVARRLSMALALGLGLTALSPGPAVFARQAVGAIPPPTAAAGLSSLPGSKHDSAAPPTTRPVSRAPPAATPARSRPPKLGTGIIWTNGPQFSTTAPAGAQKPRGFMK